MRVAIIGAGLVGSGWAVVFARAGHEVVVHDAAEGFEGRLDRWLGSTLAGMQAHGLIGDPAAVRARIGCTADLEQAVAGAGYVQESTFEDLELKRGVSARIGAALDPGALVGSSTSGFPASDFTADVPGRERFMVVHPVNPPHLMPVVEIVPAPWTDPAAVLTVRELMQAAGQEPVTLTREIDGFVLNRLQGALLDEAWFLLREGYASAADIDRTISAGLGQRWAFMGPFETIDLNAPEGIADYVRRFQPMYRRLASGSPARTDSWGEDAVARATAERRAAVPVAGLPERQAWRDAQLMALRRHFGAMKDAEGQ